MFLCLYRYNVIINSEGILMADRRYIIFIITLISSLLISVMLPAISSNAEPSESTDNFDYLLEDYQDKYHKNKQGKGSVKTGNVTRNAYIYEEPTVENLSYLFWGVNLYSVDDNYAIDEYMRLNECDIYRFFHADEIEWKAVRNATRKFLTENKNDFPSRFEFMIPLKFGDYDEVNESFDVQEDYAINSLRRFQLVAKDANRGPCSTDHAIEHSYPRAIILEFSRPFNLTKVSIPQELALDYIDRRMELMRRYYRKNELSKQIMYKSRGAYLVIKVKIFTHGKFLGHIMGDISAVQVMGVLEGYQVYEDISKKHLLYSQNFMSIKKRGKRDLKLQVQFDALIAKSKNEGILH